MIITGKRILYLLLAAGVLLAPFPAFAQENRIGVLANRGAAQAVKEWKATADYLGARTGKPFTIVPLSYDQVPVWTKEGRIEFLYANPAIYAEMNRLHGIQAIATVVNQVNNQPIDQMAGAILVRNDSPIKTIHDFKGKVFATASLSAFGGWLMACRVFVENGIDPSKDFKSLRQLKQHDNVIYAVLNGVAAGGSVRSGSLEKMVREGKIKMEDFRIINRVNDPFPLLHSTRLYPEYPMAACSHVPAGLRQEVTQALVSAPPGDRCLVDANISGWKPPLDYTPVIELLTFLKHGPFGK